MVPYSNSYNIVGSGWLRYGFRIRAGPMLEVVLRYVAVDIFVGEMMQRGQAGMDADAVCFLFQQADICCVLV